MHYYEGFALIMDILRPRWSHVQGHKFLVYKLYSFSRRRVRQFEMVGEYSICFPEEEINCHGPVIFHSRWELFVLGHQRASLLQQWTAKMAHLQVQLSLSDNLLASWSVKTILKMVRNRRRHVLFDQMFLPITLFYFEFCFRRKNCCPCIGWRILPV